MIPGTLIALLTFPGVMVHEMAHQFFCRLFRVAVYDVCYFRIGNPAGYVIHEVPSAPYQSILISVGPFLFNSVLAALIGLPAVIPAWEFGGGTFFDGFLIWLAVSIGMHAFPSTGDAQSMWQGVWSRDTFFLTKLVTLPLVAIIYLGALGSMIWLDLLYGVGIVMLIPNLLVQALAG